MKVVGTHTRFSRSLSDLKARHAEEIARLVVFLVIGGVVALANLALVWLLSHQRLLPYVVYVTIATEISIFASFLLNDRFTFRAFVKMGRPWHLRCLRFHSASALGAALTVGISTAVYHLLHFPPVAAQFTAIVIVAGVNFSMHRFWTYRGMHAPNARRYRRERSLPAAEAEI